MSDVQDMKESIEANPIVVNTVEYMYDLHKSTPIESLREIFGKEVSEELDGKDINKISRLEIARYVVNVQKEERDSIYMFAGIEGWQ